MDGGAITLEKKTGGKKMNTEISEEMKNEIMKSLPYIGMNEEEATAKFLEICAENGIEPTNPIAKGLWRNYVANKRRMDNSNTSNSGNNDLFKTATGFFVTLEEPRDMMAWNRMKAKEEFMRDSDNALEKGFVAVAEEKENGYLVSRYHDGEYREATLPKLPEGAEESDDGQIFIPLDNTAVYMNGGKNANYGKPLPKELMRRIGIFYGTVTGQFEDMKPYFFSYKNKGVDFKPKTFDWVQFVCVAGSNGTDIYGATETTLKSLRRCEDVNPEDDKYVNVSMLDMQALVQNNFDDNKCDLIDLDRVHILNQNLPTRERYVITQGSVVSLNMTPTSNGNRILNITDLTVEMDSSSFEDGSLSTTCWIPEGIDIDFGIGSEILVAGRTSQRVIDGEADPVTINVAGLYCLAKVGLAPEISERLTEENYDEWL